MRRTTSSENLTLQALQTMPMSQRRHATVILFGNSFQTFTPLQAFQQSVHAVINSSELFLLKQLIEKAVADNTLFLHSFREAQSRVLSSVTKRSDRATTPLEVLPCSGTTPACAASPLASTVLPAGQSQLI